MEIINEHRLGVAKGTVVEQDVSMNCKGETMHAKMLQGLLARYF